MAVIIAYHYPDGRIKYRKGLRNTSNREEAELFSFKKALEIHSRTARDIKLIWRIRMIMEEYDDDSAEELGTGVQRRSLQTKNAPETRIRKNKRKVEVGGKRSAAKEDPLLFNYNLFSDETFQRVSKRKDFMSDRVLLERIALMTKKQVNELGLEEPFPSSPFRPAIHAVTYHGGDGRFLCTTWAATYAAKHAVALILQGQNFTWVDSKTIRTERGDKIMSRNLEDIMEYEMSSKEAQWIMPEPEYGHLTGNPVAALRPQEEVTKTDKNPPVMKKSTGSRTQPGGTMTPQTIATELSTTPQVVRGILRKLKVSKPYSWNAEEGRDLITRVATRLKKS